jgi:hypothetical protein
MQGVYTKRSIKPVYDQRGEIASYKPNPTNDYNVYYILWSKKAVEEILSKSAPVNKDNIVYTIKLLQRIVHLEIGWQHVINLVMNNLQPGSGKKCISGM